MSPTHSLLEYKLPDANSPELECVNSLSVIRARKDGLQCVLPCRSKRPQELHTIKEVAQGPCRVTDGKPVTRGQEVTP